MKENIQFENLKEMYEKMPTHKRPTDILIKDESIFEHPKTAAQVEIIKTAYRLVGEHLKKLNIKNKPFEEKRIAFLPQQLSMISGRYHEADFFALEESSEANLGNFVHELIHAQSAEWRNYEEAEVEKFLEKNQKSVKSGFHRRVNFKTINEGITEKITREIIYNNPNEYDRLKPLFKGRMEESLAEQDRRFTEVILPEKIKEREETVAWVEKVNEELKINFTNRIAAIDKEIIQANAEEEKEELLKLEKLHEEQFERTIQRNRNIATFSDPVKIAHQIHSLKIKEIKDDYSFAPQDRTSYNFNIEIIDNIVEGIAKHNLKISKKPNPDEEKNKIWKELQVAYFHGKTHYLRKIDKAFDKGYLRRIDNLSQLLSEQEQADFLEELKGKVKNI